MPNTTLIKFADDITVIGLIVNDDESDYHNEERKMQPARGRFARSDLDRQMASTIPCPLESGPSSRFGGAAGHWNPQSGWHYSY